MRQLWELFVTFFRIGGFTIGGGYVMLPMIQKEVVEVKKWATDEEVLDYYAIGQSTPGIIAINTATFIGYKVKRMPGAIAATLGIVTPSFIIITVIAAFFSRFQEYQMVKSAFKAVRIVVVALLINTVVKMGKRAIEDWLGALLAVTAFLIVVVAELSPVWVIISSAIIGILIKYRRLKKA